MKYIKTKNPDNNKLEIFTFPKSVDHDAMAEMLGAIKNQTHGDWHRVRREPVSAGFISIDGTCYGKSETLGLAADPGDTEIYQNQINFS
jgi:hypothetical protein